MSRRRALAQRARLLAELKLILPENLPDATVTLGLNETAIEWLAQPVLAQKVRIDAGRKSGEARRAKAPAADPALVKIVKGLLTTAPEGNVRARYKHLRDGHHRLTLLDSRQLKSLVAAAEENSRAN